MTRFLSFWAACLIIAALFIGSAIAAGLWVKIAAYWMGVTL